MLKDRETWFSGYRLLWMMVLFDLPTTEKIDRKAYTKFRNFLLDQGFQMAQFSVYYRLLSGKEVAERLEKLISQNLPQYGKVQILTITDKQYENIKTYIGKRRDSQKKQDQLLLF